MSVRSGLLGTILILVSTSSVDGLPVPPRPILDQGDPWLDDWSVSHASPVLPGISSLVAGLATGQTPLPGGLSATRSSSDPDEGGKPLGPR